MDIRIAEPRELAAVFELRWKVFVVEQKVPPDLERDEEDAWAVHILAEESGAVIGCARLLLSEGEAHIGRFAVQKSCRGRGVGAAICRFIIEHCRNTGYPYIWLNAQLHAAGFYERLGFVGEGETFYDAGIEHIRMAMNINKA